ncbi:MAG: HAMP domain-containing sensor histidine kinase [Pseudomonadota bacterium]
MAVFCLTLILVFVRVQEIAKGAGQIVTVNYRTVEASEGLIQTLFALLDDQRRFAILGKPEYRQAAQADLALFGQGVADLRRQGAPPRQAWEGLAQALRDLPAGPDSPPVPEERVNVWLETLAGIQRQHRQDIAGELMALQERSEAAQRLGLLGLIISAGLSLGGSVALALYLARSLGLLKKGISRLGQEGGFEAIALNSGDELGDLARAFNHMGGRLQEEERLRAEFISTLSHEIRTPLTSIREAVNLVREGVLGPVNDRQAQFLEVSSQESIRLTALLNRLMQVSSLEAQDLDPSLAPVGAEELIAQACARLTPTAAAKRITLEQPPPGQGLTMMADAEQLGQVLINLLGNALKYSPAGGAVRLGLTQKGGQAVISVADQGPGIPREEQQFVFQKYYRGRGVDMRVDGVGLGLAISRRVAQAHGGRLWLASAPGQGSTFFLAIPLAPEPSQP